MFLVEYKCKKCKKVFDEFRPEDGSSVICPECKSAETEQNFSGKCYGGLGSAKGGCSGSCSGCSGCKK